MTTNSLSPVLFNSVSMVTTTLGVNDGSIGDARDVSGDGRYVLVYNDGGASASVGYGVVLNSGASGYSVTVTANTSADFLIGVVKNSTLTTGAYGWVLTRGFTSVQMSGTSASVSARGLLELGANGLFVPKSNATGDLAPAVGWAAAAIATGASGSAFISVFT